MSQGYLVLWQGYNTSLLAVVDTLNSGTGLSWSCEWDSQGLKVIVVALNSGTGLSWSCDWDSQVLKVSLLVTNSLVTDWVQFEFWPSAVYVAPALKFLTSYHLGVAGPVSPDTVHPRSIHQVPASHHPRCKPSPWTPWSS